MLDLFELNKLLNLYNLRIAEQNDKYYMIDYNSNSIHPLVLENGCYNYSFNLNGLPYTIRFNESTFIVNRVNEKIKINNNGFTYVDKNENENRAYVSVAESFLTFYFRNESYQASINTRNIDDQFIYLKAEEIFRKIDEKNGQLRVQFMEVQISLIGQPFFRLFHTKFDHENKVLKFHTKNESIMIYSSAKPKDDKARHFDPDNIVANWLNENSIKIIAAVAVCVSALFIVIIIVKCGKKACCKKDKKRINVENNV